MWFHADTREGFFYGFPSLDGRSIKCVDEIGTRRINPDTIERGVTAIEQDRFLTHHLSGRLEGTAGTISKSASCIYTETPDSHFLIDWHPQLENCLIVSACSGHGFKHSAAVGEIAAQLMTAERSAIDIHQFSARRFLA